MKHERIEIDLTFPRRRPQMDTSGNTRMISEFGEQTSDLTQWRQPLRSIFIEDRSGLYSDLVASRITDLKLADIGIEVETEGYAHSIFEPKIEKTKKVLNFETLTKHTYEANGFEQPDLSDTQVAKYPKYDLVRQAVEGGFGHQVRQEVEYPAGGRICALTIKGADKRSDVTLETLTLDDLPLNKLEKEAAVASNQAMEYHHKVSILQTILSVAGDRNIHGIGRDKVQIYGLSALTPYLSAKGRYRLHMKKLYNKEEKIDVSAEEFYRSGISESEYPRETFGLIDVSYALTNEIFKKRARYQEITELDLEVVKSAFGRAEEYIDSTTRTIVAEDIFVKAGKIDPRYEASVRENQPWLREYGM